MIEQIKQFASDFFSLEIKARSTSAKKQKEADTVIREFYSFCHETLHDKLGIVMNPPSLPNFLSKKRETTYKHPRRIYKISHYKNDKYGDLFVVYTSQFFYDDFLISYNEMSNFFIFRLDNNIILLLKSGMVDLDDRRNWIDEHGINDLSMSTIGEFITTHRYVPPDDESIDMEKYLSEM